MNSRTRLACRLVMSDVSRNLGTRRLHALVWSVEGPLRFLEDGEIG